MNFSKIFFSLFIISLVIGSCTPKTQEVIKTTPVTETVIKGIGLDMSMMDTNADPRNDFYNYVNGKWMEKAEIPADRGRWGSFDELRKMSSKNVLKVLEEAIASNSYPKGTDQYKAATFYQTAMDTTHANNVGVAPLKEFVDQIMAINSFEDIQRYNEKTIAYGGRGFLILQFFLI